MITRVQIKNFRSLADVDVELGPLTVFVGRNGAGKSTFLDALRFVRDALRLGLEDTITERQGITSLRRWAPHTSLNLEIGLTAQASNFWGEYSFVISSEQQGTYRVMRETCYVGRDPQTIEDSYEIRDGNWSAFPAQSMFPSDRADQPIEPTTLVLPTMALFSPLFTRMRRELRGNFYSFFPNTFREPQKPSNEKLLLDHGENLASVVQRLIQERRWYPDLVTALGRVIDGVSGVRVKQVGGFLVTELKHADLVDTTSQRDSSPWFELAQESDGTLRMLGMLVALYQIDLQQTVLALEEPEIALHPGALAVLSDVIREAAKRHQIVITTQSPDLISRFNVDELRVVERIEGVTQIGIVDEVQRETIQEQLFSAGDLLRIEGLRREPTSPARETNA